MSMTLNEDYWPDWDPLHADPSPVEDLDPHRTATYLENGVPHCYLGHPECYDDHSSERRADEADWEDLAEDR